MTDLAPDDLDDMNELVDPNFPRVDLVGKAANGALRFLVSKSAAPEDEPTPQEDEVDTTTVAKADDNLDASEVLADGDGSMPGGENTPSSAAWESVDAATALKWTAILARAKNALMVLADREAIEATVSDPDDADSVFDLDDAACAVDYAISLLAPYAVGEQVEAEMQADELMMVAKAMETADAALTSLSVLDGLVPVMKAGRVLSSANEGLIRVAAENLQQVLAALPSAPTVADPVAKNTEEPSVAAVGTVTVPVVAEVTVVKAKGDPLTPVYDATGQLVAMVDSTDLIPIASPAGETVDPADAADPAADAPAADAATDTEPAPAATVGTEADGTPAADDPDAVAKGVAPVQDVVQIVKAAMDEQREELQAEFDAKIQKMRDELSKPAPIGAALNGATPQLRGQDKDTPSGAAPTERGAVLKASLGEAREATEITEISNQMSGLAYDAILARHKGR